MACAQRRISFNSMLVDTLLGFVDDPEHRVSTSALTSLVDVAERGSAKVLVAILKYLENPDRINEVSIELLGKTAPVGDAQALEVVVRCLGAADSVGDAALQVLGKLAVRGDVATLDGVLQQLETGRLGTKARATAAMPLVSHAGDQAAMGKLRRLVSHRSWHVRVAALKSLRSISQPDMGEEQAIPALLMCLQGDSEELVRICALNALSMCAQQVDLPTLKVLVNCVTDRNLLVRRRAAILLARWGLAPTHTDDSAVIAEASEAAAAEVTKAGTKNGVLVPGTKSKAQKAAAEAGAAAAAGAQREREQYRETVLKSVTQMLVHHVRHSDCSTRAAAAWSLGMLSCCGCCADAGSITSNLIQALQRAAATSTAREGDTVSQTLNEISDGTEDDARAELVISFESILLLCDAEDVEQLSMASLPTMIKRCIEALAEISRDLLNNSTNNARLGGHDSKTPVHIFGNNSAEHLRDLIQSRLITLLEASASADEAGPAKSSKRSAAQKSEKRQELQKGAARRWMAVLAIKRCALEALARHVLAVRASEVHESEKRGEGASASTGGGGVRARVFGSEHPLFEVAGDFVCSSSK
jgi:HEAT repeat protein